MTVKRIIYYEVAPPTYYGTSKVIDKPLIVKTKAGAEAVSAMVDAIDRDKVKILPNAMQWLAEFLDEYLAHKLSGLTGHEAAALTAIDGADAPLNAEQIGEIAGLTASQTMTAVSGLIRKNRCIQRQRGTFTVFEVER